MLEIFEIKLPFFEIGPKAFLYGKEALKLAKFADALAEELNIGVIFTPQTCDISTIASNTKNISVFAQHIDTLYPGPGMGCNLPEAVKEAGAVGTFINHAEKKLSLELIRASIIRANEAGLAALVCADNITQALAIADFEPDIIIIESDSLIGKSKSCVNKDEIQKSVHEINAINPRILTLFSAGIKNENDITAVFEAGAVAAGCTSAIMKAERPFEQTEKMLRAMRKAWDKIQINNK